MQSKPELCALCGRIAGPIGSKCREHAPIGSQRVFVKLKKEEEE